MSTPRQHEILLGEHGGLAINVARWATSPTSVEATVPEVDNQIIDNAAPKITASYAGKSDILRGILTNRGILTSLYIVFF